MLSCDAGSEHPVQPADVAAGDPTMNTFQWLLILGFPPSVAAATLMPEVFSVEGVDLEANALLATSTTESASTARQN